MMENLEKSKSTLYCLKIRSSRPYFKKLYDCLIFIQNKRIFNSFWVVFFYPFSLVWLLGCYIKKIFTRKKDFQVPVISVGNLEAGGTGKTPVTIEIGKIFKSIVSKISIVSYAKNALSADEPFLISNALKGIYLIYGKNRRKLFCEAIKSNPELVIIDDGFQYFDIFNKIDIVLIDPETSLKILIPAGKMRFPFSFIKYADAILINKTVHKKNYENLSKKIEKLGLPIFTLRYIPSHFINQKGGKFPLSLIINKKVLCVVGIAKPEKFIKILQLLNPGSINIARYPDHFPYREKDMKELETIFSRQRFEIIITTEKDLIKIKNLKTDLPIYALSINIQIENYEKFKNWILERFSSVKQKNH